MKMLFLLLFLLIGLAETQAQSFTYHPLKGFHGDTISFLKSKFYLWGVAPPHGQLFLPKDTAVAVYAATFDIDFAAPYTSNYYAFGKSLSDKVSPYSIAYLLKDFVIKDIHIEAYDRRRKH